MERLTVSTVFGMLSRGGCWENRKKREMQKPIADGAIYGDEDVSEVSEGSTIPGTAIN